MKLTKKNIKDIEGLGWYVKKTEDGYFLENYSPAGGDMVIEEPDKEGIIQFCENFDPEEEFKVWYGANRGEPSSPGDLWNDCLEQVEMYDKLKEALTK